jgi:hypothetical protein
MFASCSHPVPGMAVRSRFPRSAPRDRARQKLTIWDAIWHYEKKRVPAGRFGRRTEGEGHGGQRTVARRTGAHARTIQTGVRVVRRFLRPGVDARMQRRDGARCKGRWSGAAVEQRTAVRDARADRARIPVDRAAAARHAYRLTKSGREVAIQEICSRVLSFDLKAAFVPRQLPPNDFLKGVIKHVR